MVRNQQQDLLPHLKPWRSFVKLCPMRKFSCFFSRLLIFVFKINCFEKMFKEYLGASNRLDPDQARRFVEPDLGPNCLLKLSANVIRR